MPEYPRNRGEVEAIVKESGFQRGRVVLITTVVIACLFAGTALAQEQSRESMAVDATASQWSFQLAGEGFSDYREGHPEGNNGFLQFRLVAPIAKSESMPITLLPRLTLRSVNNKDDEWGFGSSDLFILGILNEWSTGRWGLGPQINFPAKSGFGSTNWGLGLAGAVTERVMSDRIFLALLVQQTWRKNDADETKATPISINPIFVFQLGNGWYIGNGDYVINYSWDADAWFIPFGVRLGKAFIQPGKTWNTYVEYSTSVYYDDWPGPVATHAFRINFQYQLPVGI